MKSLRVTETLIQKALDVYRSTYPHCEAITYNTFPEQDEDMLDEIVDLKVRDEYEISYNEIRKTEPSGRPEDDRPWIEPIIGPDDEEDPYYFEIPCKIVRFDKVDPFVLIALSEDYDYVLIGDTRTYEDEVLVYPPQYLNMLGHKCYNRYNFIDEPKVEGFVIRQDAKDPSDGVIVEHIGTKTRYVLESECESVTLGLPDDYDFVDNELHAAELDEIREKRRAVIETAPN